MSAAATAQQVWGAHERSMLKRRLDRVRWVEVGLLAALLWAGRR